VSDAVEQLGIQKMKNVSHYGQYQFIIV
jgi:hypothetical protein